MSISTIGAVGLGVLAVIFAVIALRAYANNRGNEPVWLFSGLATLCVVILVPSIGLKLFTAFIFVVIVLYTSGNKSEEAPTSTIRPCSMDSTRTR